MADPIGEAHVRITPDAAGFGAAVQREAQVNGGVRGEAFNVSSLGGMFFAGKTGLSAAMHHAPVMGGRERYVYYALPHIAVDENVQVGACRRHGREGASTACGSTSLPP